MMNDAHSDDVSERRTQRRIETGIPVRIQLARRHESFPAINSNLSWGGGQFLLPESIELRDRHVRLIFPWEQRKNFSIDAEVVRNQPQEGGNARIATRFARLSPRSQFRLEQLLDTLASDARNADLPLTGELEVLCNDPDEISELFEQIRHERLQITTFSRYSPGQSIRLIIASTQDLPTLQLRARVIRNEQFQSPFVHEGWAQPAELVLSFEHSRKDLHKFLRLFQRQLPLSDPAARRLSSLLYWQLA